MIDVVYLDLGNTLVGDPRPAAWRSLLGRWPVPVVEALMTADAEGDTPFVSHFWGEPAFTARAATLVRGVTEIDPEELLLDYRRAARAAYRLLADLAPLRGEALMQARLAIRRSGVRFLGVVSNEAADGPLRYFRDVLGIKPTAFDTVITSSEVGFGKPSPEIFEVALNRANAPASSALYLGDSVHKDVRPALALGMKACQCVGFVDEGPPDRTWPVVETVADLPAVLRQLG